MLQIKNITEFENKEIFTLTIDDNIINDIRNLDLAWGEDFNKYINNNLDYPYFISPNSTVITSSLFNEALGILKDKYEWDVKRWYGERETYVLGVMRRVLIPDTYEPVFFNTQKISDYLETKNSQNKPFKIRSFFTGAAVAEKSLVIQLIRKNIFNFNIVSTDYSAESLILSLINLEIWNSQQVKEERLKIYLVKGDVPKNLYLQPKTVVLQVRDALYAVSHDLKIWKDDPDYRIDALLLDNALPYVSREFGLDLLKKTLELKSKNGYIIAILGLDKKIKVNISTLTKLKEIFKGNHVQNYANFLNVKGYNSSYNYLHWYNFHKDLEGNYIIKEVKSIGASKIYAWLLDLIKSLKIQKLLSVLSAVKSATSLSEASKIVKTSPTETHEDLLELLDGKKISYKVISEPINKKFYPTFSNMKFKTKKEFYQAIKEIDPLVLMSSIIII